METKNVTKLTNEYDMKSIGFQNCFFISVIINIQNNVECH